MKKYTFLAAFFLMFAAAKSQATLPSSWNMDNISAPPTGWTHQLFTNGNLIYTNTGFYNSGPQALRMDSDGEYLQVNFSGPADTVKYYVRHTGSGQDTGIFTVTESEDGSNWTMVKEYNRSLPSNITTMQMVRLKSGSRFVRFTLVDKVSGYNVALDDVTIRPAVAGAKPQLSVLYGSEITNGETLNVGSVDSFSINLKNKSTLSNIIISNSEFTGVHKDFFSLRDMPDTIAPGQTATVWVRISGAPSGSVKAQLSIYSNDSFNNDDFDILIYAINGSKATEPTVQTNKPVFTEVKAWRIKASATISGAAENVLVLVKPNATVTESPVDGVYYQRGEYIGNARVMWAGPLGEVRLDKIHASTRYYVSIFTYNGYDTFVNYNTINPAMADTMTPGLTPGSYYSGINAADTLLVSKLRAKVRPHFQVFYSNYGATVVDNFEAYDTVGGKRVITCFYSGFKKLFLPPVVWDTMSREHAYPYSWMGESSKDSANYSDLHVLFPTHQNNVNAVRSNFPFGNLKTVTYTFLGGKLGTDSNGVIAYEPRDEAKGAVARACFYECVTYNRPGKPFTIPTSLQFIEEKQDQAVLKRWNKQYPPSNREKARMEYVASVQNNRNPFIDNPDFACYIDFRNMSYVASGDCNALNSVSKVAVKTAEISVYPNPSQGQFTLQLGDLAGLGTIKVYDVMERLVWEGKYNGNTATIQLSGVVAGTYLVWAGNGTAQGIVPVVVH